MAEAMRNCAQLASAFSKGVSRIHPNPLEAASESAEPDTGIAVLHSSLSTYLMSYRDKKKRKRREKKDPNEPKRPTSAYLLFQNEVRKYYVDKHPGKTYTEVLNEISKSWKGLSEEKKDVR